MPTLTDRDREILEFARLTWNYAGYREIAIRERFGISALAFDQQLYRLIRTPAADAFDPFTVRRLRFIVDKRRVRSA